MGAALTRTTALSDMLSDAYTCCGFIEKMFGDLLEMGWKSFGEHDTNIGVPSHLDSHESSRRLYRWKCAVGWSIKSVPAG